MADENAEIARGLRRRDPDLLDHLIEKYQHRLLRFLIHRTGRRELAEDVFQETWIRVLERGAQYDSRYEFSAWLFSIARNLAIDHERRRHETDTDDADLTAVSEPSAIDLAMRHEQSSQILAAMQNLTAEHRETLALRFQEEMSLEEIGRVTGAPLSTVKSRLYRGLTALAPWVKGVGL